MWVKDIITMPAAMSEFGLMARAIVPVMTDNKASRIDKRKMLCSMVSKLSDRSFNNGFVANQVIKIINMREDVCKEYPNTQTQVKGITDWLPRMEAHRARLIKAVQAHRKQYGLNL